MKYLRALAALPLFTAACCAPVPEPEPSPAPAKVLPPAPAPAPLPVQQQTYDNWLDAPQTPGDWTYRGTGTLSFALFGEPGQGARFGIECNRTSRRVALVRASSIQTEVPMRIRTETAERILSAVPETAGTSQLVAALPANDRLLDAIALSRGRFAVETGGMETLYLPSWPEITRVVEDCR